VPFLSPAKLLVVLVVALVVLGPDRLPKVAKQAGALWRDLRTMRERLESGVRDTFPDLPSTERMTQVVRSPLSFLDELADSHAAADRDAAEPEDPVPTAVDSVVPAGPTGAAPGSPGDVVTVVDPRGAVHRVRATGGIVPDDASLN
jgi:sec-independent protein translocase protein TatB